MPVALTRLRRVEFAVIDLETTGLIAGKDRVVEIAVCHVDEHGPPRVAFSSLVNPERSVTATEIHGLTSVHVADAPRFCELSNELSSALEGRVLVGYNVSHDLSMLIEEWRPLGFSRALPHVCALRVRSGLGRGWQTLSQACAAEGISMRQAHSATDDALATAELFHLQLGQLAERGVVTLRSLAEAWPHAFAKSLSCEVLGALEIPAHASRPAKPRTSFLRASNHLAIYQNAVMVALADFHVSEGELRGLRGLRASFQLPDDFVRAVHARVFAMFLALTTNDERLDQREAMDIHRLWRCLSILGWAPGSPLVDGLSPGSACE